MLRDFKFLRRHSGKQSEEIENVPVNTRDSLASQASTDSCRPPLNAIHDPNPASNPVPELATAVRSKVERTPTKPRLPKNSDSSLPLRTPDKHGAGVPKKRFGWTQRNDESCAEVSNPLMQLGRGGLPNVTPRSTRTVGRANSSYSESNSTQSTPTKSISKPPSLGFRSKIDGNNGGGRVGNFAALYRGIPVSGCSSTTVVNTVEVPHFDLKEDPSFWMEHNVQVLIRVRPLNHMERSMHGYNRCLKQESSQSITWIGQPESRFTFDHVACETVDQEMLFRMAGLPMVENCLSGYNSCMFAYGQTGSGKTYTMLGEIDDLEFRPSPNRGMTPRIFEFLFARIQAEEESRRDERLKYYCKCSFLEIYNEQIADLLDPCSTNLLLREDVKKGVYVENLSEFEVQTVGDVLKLLTQGSLNRKVAATNMNRESSRSHSVFTCVIESRWEKDSTTNLRFARLNLVDLAGSERQKSSGAEGERLKEAANINKSLSTLGHVIMILLDVAQGKPKHVPYRDSRLTFLLQDSLGGNSKTMIIANVSPSICCAAETLNTLKFAQRAKLIQNNAVVNEDSTGDVIALQHQIRLLKEELALVKRQNVFRSLSFDSTEKDDTQVEDNACPENIYETLQQQDDALLGFESKGIVRVSTKQLKSLEITLAGALRREQMAENSIKKLEAEIEQSNRLVRQREEDTRSMKMMLRFREDRIQRMESLVGGLLSSDTYLLEENRALSEEIQLLQAKMDKNPEVTRFALENIRLLEQLRRFQEFYEEGEREILLDEVSTLRDQLLQLFDGKAMLHNHPNEDCQAQEAIHSGKDENSLHLELKTTLNELENCRRNLNSCLEENKRLSREVHNLHAMLDNLKYVGADQDQNVTTIKDSLEAPTSEHGTKVVHNDVERMHATRGMKNAEEILDLQLELDILKIILKEERFSRVEVEEMTKCSNQDLELARKDLLLVTKQCETAANELKETKSVVEALDSQQILAMNEIEDLRKFNGQYVKLLSEKEREIMVLKEQLSRNEFRNHRTNRSEDDDSTLQKKFRRMHDSLDKAKRLNMWYQSDRAFHESNEEEMDEVRRQAEAETAEVIVCMQEELSILQQQVQDFHSKEKEMEKEKMLMEIELKHLQEKLQGKDEDLRKLTEEWALLSSEMEEVLVNGQVALGDVSDQLDLISSSFPQRRIWISEQVGRMIRIISEKELLIEELGKGLEDANAKRNDVEYMLKSLRGAALVINEAHQQECIENEKEILLLKSQLKAKKYTIADLEEKVKLTEHLASKSSHCATVAFVIVNRLSETNLNNVNELQNKDIKLGELAEINHKKETLLDDYSGVIKAAEKEIESLRTEMAALREVHAELQQRLSEEEEKVSVREKKLEDVEENNILVMREKLDELRSGVLTVRSCLGIHRKEDTFSDKNEIHGGCMPIDVNSERTDSRENLRAQKCSLKVGKSLLSSSCVHNDEEFMICKDVYGRDATISLVKEEIESAVESLQEVQEEMVKLRKEKEEIWMSEKECRESMKDFATQILELLAAISNFENRFEMEIKAVNCRLKATEQIVQETGTSWCHMKEFIEMEVGDSKIAAAQKAAEASCIYAKFEEAQDTMKEADMVINELVTANEMMKLDMERLKERESTLNNEKNMLINEVQSLKSFNVLKDQEFKDLEEQFGSNLMETRELVVGLEEIIAQVQITFKENYVAMVSDFDCLKALVSNSGSLMHSWLEDIWSEIIMKDCAVSVLHLCHMGIMLETVTGLNAENGLLQHGLCESNSVISDLREHNSKSSRELNMCRTLKGKLLTDIKNSFDRITRKEEETGKLDIKLITFEKKISDLQLQEESMLQRSNDMASQLAVLIKELNLSDRNVFESLFDQDKMLKDKEKLLDSQAEHFMIELCSKDIELFILSSQFKNLALEKVATERELSDCGSNLESIKKELIFTNVFEVALLQTEIEDLQKDEQDLLLRLKHNNVRISEMDEVNTRLEREIKILRDVACTNDKLKCELEEVVETKAALLYQVQTLEVECDKLLNDLKTKETALEDSSSHVSLIDEENLKLQKGIQQLEATSNKLQNELDMKDAELSKMCCLEEENKSLKSDLWKLKTENNLVIQNLEKKNSEVESSLSRLDISDTENHKLQEIISSLESLLSSLQSDLKTKNDEVDELVYSQSAVMTDLCSKSQDLQDFVSRVNLLKDENDHLRNEVRSAGKDMHEMLTSSSLKTVNCIDSLQNVEMIINRLVSLLNEDSMVVVDEICKSIERTSEFVKEIECLECHANELVSDNSSLRAELLRKDDIVRGLLFDMSLLQESASNTKDLKDEIEEMVACSEALEDELKVKSDELAEAVARSQMLEALLQEKIDIISTQELELTKVGESLKTCSHDNLELRGQIQEALVAKLSLEEELAERKNMTDNLEVQLSQMGNAFGQINDSNETLRSDLDECTSERDQLHMEIHCLKEKLEKAQAWAEENEAIALEAQQLVESTKNYAEDKETEVQLLEKSVEELECTVNVLENKVDILKGEAERQRLQREELEMELHAVNHQMQNVKSCDTDMKRRLEKKEKDLEEALGHMQILERDIAEKNAELAQCKAHISELNLHAEAQASEFKQKFKALEAMAEQVKPEGHLSHVSNSLSNKSEKGIVKGRGSGSPFKCIGLGLAQQMKSEKDEDFAAARMRIEELESLAASRQKEIFALHARLAAAESMTHDVIRDLLGVKLDMTNCVSFLDNHQVQKLAEKVQLSSLEPQVKEQEVTKLKHQLNEFIQERHGWLEEIDRKQAEVVAMQIALEKLRQRDQLLSTENEMLKMETVNHKKRVMELEGEVKKLSGQQNLQQRIHHHAKIKDENNLLRRQNEDLSVRLHRAEVIISRVKEELAQYRASNGKKPYSNFDEEQRLVNKLKESEDDRMQLAHKLLALCTSILKAAGIAKSTSNITPAVAEEALEQLKSRLDSSERELQDMIHKNRITSERICLSELLPESSPVDSRQDENYQTPRRGRTPFLSVLDR